MEKSKTQQEVRNGESKTLRKQTLREIIFFQNPKQHLKGWNTVTGDQKILH